MAEVITDKLKRYSYTFDKNTGELEYPDVFLSNNRLKKKGLLYPIEGLEMQINENAANEISFSISQTEYNKDLYTALRTNSIVLISNSDYFTIKVTEEENGDGIVKKVSGTALSYSELSNISGSLSINTEEDIARDDYYSSFPTVFYRPKNTSYYEWDGENISSIKTEEEKLKVIRESSLLDRILTYAPHYTIGHVDKTLYFVQKTFSWDYTDIMSILNEVSQEVGCIFTFDTYLRDDGTAIRELNAYDITYCKKCYENAMNSGLKYKSFTTDVFRNVVNGVCQNCNSSSNVYDYGDDTDIFITTENLTDEISIDPDNEVKNTFSVTGGDDVINAAVQAISLSGSNKIMMFSDEEKEEMSDKLRDALEKYEELSKKYQPKLNEAVLARNNIIDLILYLQSGKMPTSVQEEKGIVEEVKYLFQSIKKDWNNKFYIASWSSSRENGYMANKEGTSRVSITKMFKLYLDKGWSISISAGTLPRADATKESVRWDGRIRIYETSNNKNYADIYCHADSSATEITFALDSSSDYTTSDFYVDLAFGDINTEQYASYIKQYCDDVLAKYQEVEYKNEEIKPWENYCYNRLKAYSDGYTECLDVLDEMIAKEQTGESFQNIAQEIKNNYSNIQYDITIQMLILQNQINALYYLYGVYDYTTDDFGNKTYSPEFVSEDYYKFKSSWLGQLKILSLKSYEKFYVGEKPIHCNICGSSNVEVWTKSDGTNYNVCQNCGDNSDITNYSDLAKQVYNYALELEGSTSDVTNKNTNIAMKITEYNNLFNLQTFLDNIDTSLFPEYYSFIKEQEYNNPNYTSEGCGTNELIMEKAQELINKATQELSKACVQQYSISAPVFATVVEKWKNWSKDKRIYDEYNTFKLGNWVRVRLNDIVYKLRVIGINLNYDSVDDISVTFSNVTKTKYGATSDVANILEQASSVASSYDYYATQAEQGKLAKTSIDRILEQGLNSNLVSVLAGSNQDVVIDGHGITLRKYLDDVDDYSPYQMKIINRNIVMTKDNWKTSSLAIGYGMLPDGTYDYGIWANYIIGGQITCTKNLKIVGGDSSVVIDGDGIHFEKNSISTSSIDGLDDTISSINEDTDSVKNSLDSYKTSNNAFNNKVANSLTGGNGTDIGFDYVISPKIGGGYLYITQSGGCSVTIDPLGLTGNGSVFSIKNSSGNKVMDVDSKGNATFSGDIKSGSTITCGNNFSVNASGKMKATGAEINGTITSSNGGYNTLIANGKLILGKSDETELLNMGAAGDFIYSDDSSYSRDNIVGVQINSSLDVKWLSFGHFDTSDAATYTSYLLLNYGMNPGGAAAGIIAFKDMEMNSAKLWFKDRIKNKATYIEYATYTLDGNENKVIRFQDGMYVSGNAFIEKGFFGSEYDQGRTIYNGYDLVSHKQYTHRLNFRYMEMDYFNDSGNLTTGSFINCGSGSDSDAKRNWISLGIGSCELHLYGKGVYLGGGSTVVTSDRRLKKDISDIEKYENMFMDLKPKSFKYLTGTSDRLHIGFIAQDVLNSMDNNGISTKDFAGIVESKADISTYKEKLGYIPEDIKDTEYGLRYEEFIALNTHMIQKLYKKIETLEEEITKLKS